MAAYYPGHGRGRTSLGASSSVNGSQLPTGSCNYRDIHSGERAPTCGCERFWLNESSVQGGSNGPAFCFCGHHACFHGSLAHSQQQVSDQGSAPHLPIDLIQAEARGRNTPEGYYSVRYAGASPVKQPAGLGIRQESHLNSQSITNRVFDALNGFARDQEDGSRSGDTSKLPSTAVQSVNGDFCTYQSQPMAAPITIPPTMAMTTGFEDVLGSATEVATPSIAGTPDMRAFAPPGTQSRISPMPLTSARNMTAIPAALPAATALEPVAPVQVQSLVPANNLQIPQDVQDKLQTFERRLDILESLSFAHVPVEEVHDRFELLDGRMLDLEHWRSEQEQQQRMRTSPEPHDKAPSDEHRRLLPSEGSSFASDGSFDNAAAMQTETLVLATLAANAETGPRIDALESRVNELEGAALPSYARPWQVQVVLLPWGRQLRGIWFSSSEATQQSIRSGMHAEEEWTGAPSTAKGSFQSSVSGAWTTESIQAWAEDAQDWLSPKACGPSGTVFQRLASRGCVRDVTFTSYDSRHILDMLGKTFRSVLADQTPIESDQTEYYQGLREAFLPLRKVRKSTRLRFLSQAEMVTSASWNAAFLESSVFMKVGDGERRLYVTTPHAYVQGSSSGLSWRQIQRLPPRGIDGEAEARQIDSSVAIEACWSYSEKLDHAPSLHSSFGSQASHGSRWAIQDQQKGSTQNAMPHPMSPLSESRPPRQRTVSLPSTGSAVDQSREALSKRRVASFETNGTVPITASDIDLAASKRRRISTSPEAERRGLNFTPRYSREPTSPLYSEHVGEARSQGGASGSRKRGTTPFAYATPHSGSNFATGRPDFVPGEGDTEVNTDIAGAESERAEEEWEGVEDGEALVLSEEESDENDSQADDDDEDEDEDGIDDDLMSYEAY